MARLCLVVLSLAVAAGPIAAHPMGNFSVNQYFLLDLRAETPVIYYLADIAEIPSFTELDLLDTDFDSQVTREEEEAYLNLRVPELMANLSLSAGGEPVVLKLAERKLVLLEGMGGMIVFNLLLQLQPADFDAAGQNLVLTSTNFEGESGTRECKVILGGRFKDQTGDLGRETLEYQTLVQKDDADNPVYQDFDAQFLLSLSPIEGAVPMANAEPIAFDWTATARGARESGEQGIADGLAKALTEVVEDAATRTNEDNDVVAENVDAPRTSPAATPVERALDDMITTSRRDVAKGSETNANLLARVSDLIRSKELSPPLFLFGMLIAAAMGMGHAFSPGHGKTVMAAYLIGERGTSWHALILGIIVTITHTWSILLLGIVVLYAGEAISEEQLQFWTGIASGLIILGLGIVLFQRRYRTYVIAKYGAHSHGHDHHHHGDDDDHGHSHVVETEDGAPPTYGSILWLGISGGIVPCPAALIVLLLALKFGRLFYGLWLIVAFSIGLAAVLVAIGIIVVRTAGAVRERTKSRPGIILALPVFSSALITVLGGWIVFWTLIQFEVLVILPGG